MKKVLFRVMIVLLILAALLGAYLVYNHQRNQTFVTTFYQVETEKDISDLRVVLLSDLHLREFGEDNCDLVAKIEALSPDLIALAGDMCNDIDANYEPVITLLNQLTPIAPTYYVAGNHEWVGAYANGHRDMIDAIRATDVVYLENGYEEVTIGENTFFVGGLYYREGNEKITDWAIRTMDAMEEEDGFKLLLCHFPEVFIDAMADYDIDLALCGHAHGGQVRLPFTEGLWCEGQGFLPKYTSGLHTLNQTLVCISRGLGDSNHIIPRINNQPELVVIDIN